MLWVNRCTHTPFEQDKEINQVIQIPKNFILTIFIYLNNMEVQYAGHQYTIHAGVSYDLYNSSLFYSAAKYKYKTPS